MLTPVGDAEYSRDSTSQSGISSVRWKVCPCDYYNTGYLKEMTDYLLTRLRRYARVGLVYEKLQTVSQREEE